MREDVRALNAVGAAALLLIGALSLTGIVVVVTEIPPEHPTLPRVELRSDEARDRVSVISAEQDHAWDDFDIQLRYSGAWSFQSEGEPVEGEHLVFNDIEIDEPVEAGDHFHVCRYGESLPQVVTLRHKPTLRLVGIWHFSEVPDCDALPHGHEG